MNRELLRRLPQVEKALQSPPLRALSESRGAAKVLSALREVLGDLRSRLLRGDAEAEKAAEGLTEERLAERVERRIARRDLSSYRRAINGTGVILHTGLGRAALPPETLETLRENLAGSSILEVDVATGERNQREDPLGPLFGEITGAEAAIVVNNNAAATLLILAALGRGREVIVSRGQLIEIGGSFRIPDILRESGARLVEVGTTNRTYASDYRGAVTTETALLLKVHTSNYEIRGFAHHTPLEELVEIGREFGIPVVSDLGSGCLVDISPHGPRREPLVRESVEAGADLVCCSGDKLLGGPQAGIIVGRREMVARLRAHPLYRAVRVDKMTLSALESTLRIYREPDTAWRRIPPLRMLSASVEDLRTRARAFLARLGAAIISQLHLEVVESKAEMGSGSLPAQEIPSCALELHRDDLTAREIARLLRSASPAVFTRVHSEAVVIDFRTILPEEEDDLCRVILDLARGALEDPEAL
ncbi:MAG: L-seryl-tRNA(Sec) selenium transferase [Planctomycetes bacterium]|nr:L-seryl-tRNA(Sec) selenium transferase [Planctomycetota bacterium]